MVSNKNSNWTNSQFFSWDTFMLSVFYIWNIPQLLNKFIKAENIPAFFLSAPPDKLVIFWRVILFSIFVFIIPWLISYFCSPDFLSKLKEKKIWWWKVWKYLYWLLWIGGCIIFLFYFATEIAWIQEI